MARDSALVFAQVVKQQELETNLDLPSAFSIQTRLIDSPVIARLKLDKEVGVLDVRINKLEQQIEKENNTLDNLQNKQLTTSL